MGTLLFHMSRRWMVPTATGQRIIDTAQPVLAELDSLNADLRQMRE